MREYTRQLLDEVLVTHAPSGVEAETEAFALEHFGRYCDEVWRDPHDNIVAKIAGQSSDDATLMLAHKDEIAVMVRQIDEDGKIWLEPLGGTHAWRYGEGPFDLLVGGETITGILCVGSSHTSHLSSRIHKAKTDRPMDWESCYLDCKRNREELTALGVRIGSVACVARSRKKPTYLQERFIGGYALDDKAALVSLILAMKQIRESGRQPKFDVYFAATSIEEVGISGGAYAIRHLTGRHTINTVIAAEIAPVAEEYSIRLDERPVILVKDTYFVYHAGLVQDLIDTCERLNLGHQETVVRSFGSDTSSVVRYGYIGRWACVAFATENTHGYEVADLGGIENVGKLLAGYALGV
jgi:putative aminopeptidase FrvX